MTTGTVKLTQQGRVPGKVKKTWTMSHTPEGDQSTGVYTSAKADNYRSIFTKFGVATVEFHVKASNLCPPATIKHQNASPIFFHSLLQEVLAVPSVGSNVIFPRLQNANPNKQEGQEGTAKVDR